MTARTSLLIAPKPSPAPLPGGGLVTANAPPIHLPGEHFIVAYTCFILGTVGLAVMAPALAQGTFINTQVAAVVHLFTLGFISTSIFGALYQFLPVAVGAPIRSQRIAHITFAILVMGIATFLSSLAIPAPSFIPIGGGAVALAFAMFAGNFIATLAVAKERDVTWWALAGASLYLIVTLGFGFTLALNLTTNVVGSSRFELLFTHIHVAVVGWVMLVMVGVGHRLVPMFVLSHGATETPAKVAVAGLIFGCALIALPLGTTVHTVGLSVVAMGVVAFLVQVAAFYKHRKKSDLDPGMRLAFLGLGGISIALMMGPIAWMRGWQNVQLLTTYVFFLIIGGVSLFIAGHYFKIVPFIVWYHRFGAKVGKGKVPRVSDLYSAKAANLALGFLALGALTTAAGIMLGSTNTVRTGALLLFSGACIEGREMIRIARVRAT